jgi:magnesium transporter
VVRILTVLVILMFSLTLIAGIYGINPRIMPELPSPYGQYAVFGFVAFIAIIMLVFFRWKNRL